MSTCPHNPPYPNILAVPSMEESLSRAKLVNDDPKVKVNRALTSEEGTRVDAPYWQTLNDAQKCALMAHEMAHTSRGLGIEVSCEGCADKMGGYFMRAWGYAPHVVKGAYASLRVKRKPGMGHTPDNAAAGAHAAEMAMAARGLLGLPTSKLSALRSEHAARAVHSGAVHSGKESAGTKGTPATPPLTSAQHLDPGGPAPAAAPAEGITPATGHTETQRQSATGADTVKLNGSGTLDSASGAASKTAPTAGTGATTDHVGGFAADIVASVLGDDARPYAIPVLIGAGVAATLAIGLVIVVRHVTK